MEYQFLETIIQALWKISTLKLYMFYLFDSAKWLNEKGDYSYFLMSKSTVSFTIFIHPYTEMYVAIVDILVII